MRYRYEHADSGKPQDLAVFAFILIYANQIGIGILTFQRLISKEAGYDAWISILMTGVSVHSSCG